MERMRKAAIHILTLTTIHYKMNLLQIIFHVHSKAHQLSHVCQWRPVKIYSLDSHLLAFCRHAYHLMRSRQREKVSVCQRLKAPCQWVDMRWELRPRRWWSYSWAYVCCFLCALSFAVCFLLLTVILFIAFNLCAQFFTVQLCLYLLLMLSLPILSSCWFTLW